MYYLLCLLRQAFNTMDTQRIKTHDQVVEAMRAVADESVKYMPGTPERDMLDQTYDDLKEVSWKLIAADVSKWVEAIQEASKKLLILSNDMDKESKKLKKISDIIGAVAKTVGVLSEIMVKAASVGIL